MSEHAALLCAFIGFFMHERSLRLFWVLLVYDGALALYHVAGVFYVVLRRLYVDDVSRERANKAEQEKLLASTDTNGITNSSSNKKRRVAKNPFKYTLLWRGALRRCLKLIAVEL
eukprot:gene35566-46127_t